jgi:hypothetical protein
MAYRQFVDSRGREWSAFDVVPRENERRKFDRRISSRGVRAPGAERRERDRRLTIGGRMYLRSGADAGWLFFEHDGDCRRLAPIPDHWAAATDEELESYCESAAPVKKSAAVNRRR